MRIASIFQIYFFENKNFIWIFTFQFFLAVANYGAAMDGSSTISTIFRWNIERQKFRVFQQLQTWTATDIEFFDIKGTKFIAVVNYAKG